MTQEAAKAALNPIADAVVGIMVQRYADKNMLAKAIVDLLNGQPDAESKAEVLSCCLKYANVPFQKELATNEEVFDFTPDDDFGEKMGVIVRDFSIKVPSTNQMDDADHAALVANILVTYGAAGEAAGELGQIVVITETMKLFPIYGSAPEYAPTDRYALRAVLSANPEAFVTVSTLLAKDGVTSEDVIGFVIDQGYEPEVTKALLALASSKAVADEHRRSCPNCNGGGMMGGLGAALMLGSLLGDDGEDDFLRMLLGGGGVTVIEI